jgi:hypothetical protein
VTTTSSLGRGWPRLSGSPNGCVTSEPSWLCRAESCAGTYASSVTKSMSASTAPTSAVSRSA